MKEWIKKHKKIAASAAALIILLVAAAAWHRGQVLSNVAYDDAPDEKRGEAPAQNTYYTDQLTQKEYKAYTLMLERLDDFAGGVVVFPEPLTGEEYMRVTTALEDTGNNYFYGFYDIPMDDAGVYLKYDNSDILRIADPTISQCILFLSCAEGIDQAGEYDDDGTVRNLEAVGQSLAQNDPAEVDYIDSVRQETETVMADILNGLEDDAGKKEAIAYFLEWMDGNMEPAADVSANASGFTTMGEVFEGVNIYNDLSALTKGRATPLGYAKIFAQLCRSCGMDAHLVFGQWGKSAFTKESYVLCAVTLGDETVYVDASGGKSAQLAGHRCMMEEEARNHMEPVSYFD